MKKILLAVVILATMSIVPAQAQETDKTDLLKAAAVGAAIGAGIYYVVVNKDELLQKAKDLVNKIPTTDTKKDKRGN